MGKMKIWGRKTSSNVQKVLWLCGELGLDYERIDIGGPFGGNDKPEYRALNPNGLVPTVEIDGLVLWESNSILRYLARKYGPGSKGDRCYSTDLGQAALIERWLDWQLSTFNPAFTPVFMALVRTPPEKRDPKALEAGVKRAGELYRILDTQLGKGPFLNGAELTIADIPMGINTYRWFTLPIDRPNLPNLAAWYQRLQARPPFKTHVMIPIE
jgi:glutathione S-transferase